MTVVVGSRIVLTTRLSDVGAYADTFGSTHHMQFLNVEQSWNLLREKVFAQEPCPFELEDPGMQIAENCRGLPLAIVAVAGILSKVRRTRNDWYNIASCVSLAVTENDEHFSRILTLSYNHLPHHLKACFLYFGCFPEDYEISVPRLIRLWIAEGFLRPNESKSLEEVGEEYLEDLVKRNLILMVKKRYNGRLRFCNIHDLLRDLCIKRARYENFFHFTNEKGYLPEGRENVCRASLNHPFWDDRLIITDVVPDSLVRSIICFHGYSMNYKTPFGFRLLRVLDALAIQLPSFPYKLLELFHLRYLALYLDPDFFTGSLELSPSISKLENLQTFIVGTRVMLSLPSQIWELPQLRHLIITKMTISSLLVYPGLDVVLENLQTLQKIENLELNEHIVKRIPNLNKLKVRYTDPQRAHWEFYCLNNLAKLCKLEELNIIFDLLWDGANHFPESFAFPRNLKKLSLDGCRLPWENMTVVGSLPNLQSLKLKDYAFLGQKWETRDGEFLRLKFLLMKDLDLKCWRAENTHFPCLEHLKIRYCGDLEEIPLEIGEIPTLELIEVHESKSAAHSAMLIQEEQRSMGNDTLQVRISQRKYK